MIASSTMLNWKCYPQALKLFELSAAQGFSIAQGFLGYCHDAGTSVNDVNFSSAMNLYRLAADQGLLVRYCINHFDC